MDYLIFIFSLISYIVFAYVVFNGRARTVFLPSSLAALSIILQCSPFYLLTAKDGYVSGELFSTESWRLSLALVFGYYSPIVFYFIFIRQRVIASAGRGSAFIRVSQFRRTDVQSKKILLFAFAVLSVLFVFYVFLSPRWRMLKDVIYGLSSITSDEYQYLRRVEYAGGFFLDRVYSWSRYSIWPIYSLLLLALVPTRGKSLFLFFSVVAYGLYFMASASFLKATWVLGVVYIASFFYFYNKGNNFREFNYIKLLFVFIVSAAFLITLITFGYLFQYGGNHTLTVGYHIAGAYDRLANATPFGMAWFLDYFPRQHEFIPIDVLFSPFVSNSLSPESMIGAEVVPRATTIQAGVFANLYAGCGWFAVPLYHIFVFIVFVLTDRVFLMIKGRNVKAIALCVLGVALAWQPQMALYISIFSSGLFLSICVFFLYSIFEDPGAV